MSRRKAVIEDDKVVNVIVAEDDYEDPRGRQIIDGEVPTIGMVRYRGRRWMRPEDVEDEGKQDEKNPS